MSSTGTVVSREEVRVNDERFMRLIRYVAKSKEFRIELPQSVALALDKADVTAETQDAAVDAFNEACDQAKALKTSRRKVLIVKYKAKTKIGDEWIPPLDDAGHSRYSWNQPDPSENVLELGYQVGEEHTFGDRKEYIVDGKKTNLFGDDHKVIEWTKEREQFFVDVLTRFKFMIKSVSKFMTQAEPQIVKAIAARGNRDMLSLPEPKESKR